jgi:hypothetical protein
MCDARRQQACALALQTRRAAVRATAAVRALADAMEPWAAADAPDFLSSSSPRGAFSDEDARSKSTSAEGTGAAAESPGLDASQQSGKPAGMEATARPQPSTDAAILAAQRTEPPAATGLHLISTATALPEAAIAATSDAAEAVEVRCCMSIHLFSELCGTDGSC